MSSKEYRRDDSQTIECDTAKQMVEELDPAHERWVKNHWRNFWIFRGHADSEWRLVASALREEFEGVDELISLSRESGRNSIKNPETFLQESYSHVAQFNRDYVLNLLLQLYAESVNIREFFELADSLSLSSSIPNPSRWPVFGTILAKSYVEHLFGSNNIYDDYLSDPAIAVAQHHGVATRLLDWTKHPLYAAFFACEGITEKTTHIAVYAIHQYSLRGSDVRLIEIDKAHSKYIHSQEGIFTLDTGSDLKYLQTGKWRSLLDIHDQLGTIYKITLPVEEVPELVRLLWLRRVTKAHMMPTLDNVIPALKSKRKWQIANEEQ